MRIGVSSSPSPSGLMQVTLQGHENSEYQDFLAEESPLELIIQGVPYAVFMRTPGHDLDLITGFLFTERIIEELDDINVLTTCETHPDERVHLQLASGVQVPKPRRSMITSSCGLCSLTMLTTSSEVRQPSPAIVKELTRLELNSALSTFDKTARLFTLTGGAHAAALFSQSGELMCLREDIGRHNAVDKVIGAALRNPQLDLSAMWLLVSSRAGYEIVSKASAAGVRALVTIGAASSGAHRLSLNTGLPLYSFTRVNRTHFHMNQPKQSDD